MFDIGFWELITLAMLALLIVGPEKLPKVARDAGNIVAKVRRFIHDARLELEREIDDSPHQELKKSIDHVEQLMKEAPDRLLGEEEFKQKSSKS
ncbi:MAG: Sec-independent protein translocase protein TatB [Pseudomonadota bacterium]